jgi:hypothetical protein
MARNTPTSTDLTDQSVALAEFAANVLVAAEQSGVKKKPIQEFPLNDTERAAATTEPAVHFQEAH